MSAAKRSKPTTSKNVVVDQQPDYEFDIEKIGTNQLRLQLLLDKCQANGTCTFYKQVTFRAIVFERGDMVELYDINLNTSIICQISQIVQCPEEHKILPFLQVKWYLRKENLPSSLR